MVRAREGAAQRVPSAVFRTPALRGPERAVQGQRAPPLVLRMHMVGKKSRRSDLFSDKLPIGEVWYFDSVSALFWREVVF